ncbi:Phytocyanin domain-containing protein [Heracleum sosnowskyi]|uniref:Phytocyanin domain-containing protein n=1 Tax=Heracleum sosnowskyi TaxID=360622 RepID=A0AAD8I901_9APIA|nr:Phytocyanin domain-containing protein [Heracleum sosnowskyi]
MGLTMEKKKFISSAAVLLGLMLLVSQLQVTIGAVYKVGDSAGWTIAGSVDYRKWSAAKTFHVGDTILFQYNSQFHNVMQVRHAEYKSCNASAPMSLTQLGMTLSPSLPKATIFFCVVFLVTAKLVRRWTLTCFVFLSLRLRVHLQHRHPLHRHPLLSQ